MIHIQINGESTSLDAEMSIQTMLDTVPVPPNYLAVEINGEVVPREEYAQHQLKDGDDVELVTLVGGG